MPRAPSMTAEMHRQLGELAATQAAQGAHLERMDETMREDRHAASEDRRLMLAKLDALSERLGKMEPDGAPLPSRLQDLEKEAAASRLFRARVGAVVGLAGSAAGLLLAGLGYLLNHFWSDLVSLLSRLLPRP
ncbi:hypothetical protein [Xanthobacter aminoxidans]|uniref:hypothetical protein n=1 Tax=Xanthobacter aminoxidans TaxID=186280 RepID=UPI002022EFD9|nr:hypothetical protein [Xanthobacter aminoxidans]MCL8385667.1 hypothetical protein [Xanthobacter aminoxidans]